jgi:hypothetical protein
MHQPRIIRAPLPQKPIAATNVIASPELWPDVPSETSLLIVPPSEPTWPALGDQVLSDFLRQWARVLNASPGLVQMSLLVAVATALGTRVRVQIGAAWVEPSLLWAVGIAPPGARKTTAVGALISILKSIETADCYAWKMALAELQQDKQYLTNQWSKFEKDAKRAVEIGEDAPPTPQRRPEDIIFPGRPHIVMDDATPAALVEACDQSGRGFLLRVDEAPRIFEMLSSSRSRSLFLEGYNAAPYTVERVLKSNVRTAERFGFSMLGTIQNDRMRALPLGSNDGLFARFLWVSQPASLPVSIARDAFDAQIAHDILERVRTYGAVEGERRIMYSGSAISLIEGSIDRWSRLAARAGGLMEAWYHRANSHCARLSLVLHALTAAVKGAKTLPAQMDAETVKLAVKLVDEVFAPNARQALSLHGLTKELGAQHALIKYLHANNIAQFNRRELRRANTGLFGTTEVFNLAVDDLVLRGLVRQAQPEPGHLGRKAGDYLVSPKLLAFGRG